jgi:hypothetical protein
MGAAKSRSLRFASNVRLQHFVRRSTCVPFRRFWGMSGNYSSNVFVLLFMALWAPIFATLCMRILLMLWQHTFLFFGISFFPPVFFLHGDLHCLFL